MATSSSVPPPDEGGQATTSRRIRQNRRAACISADTPRTRNGRVLAKLARDEALDALGALIRAVGDPLTMARLDGAIDREGGPLPGVRALISRFDLPFAGLVSLALADPAERGRVEAQLRGKTARPVDIEHIYRCLRWANYTLGYPPSQLQYDLLALERNRRFAALGVEDPADYLPCAATIRRRGTWVHMLRRAGIIESRPPTPTPNPAPPVVETASAYVDATGLRPAWPALEDWARSKGIRLPWRDHRPSIEELVEMVTELRRAQGKDTPTARTLPRNAPPIEPTALSRADRRSGEAKGLAYSRAQALASVAHYLAQHTSARVPPRAKHYQAVASDDPALVSYNALQPHGPFQVLVREARRLIAKESS